MASLTSPRATIGVGPQVFGDEQVVKSGSTVVQGCFVQLDGSGAAVDGYAASGLTTLGIANDTVTGDGTASVAILSGEWLFDNGTSTDALTQADVGKTCYVLDNHTVSRLSSGKSAAGTAQQIVGANDPQGAGQIVVLIQPA